jgi:hypothetical protein
MFYLVKMMQEREINDIRMFNGTASLNGYFSPVLKVLSSETDLWLKVGSFDGSSFKSEARRFSEKSVCLPSW